MKRTPTALWILVATAATLPAQIDDSTRGDGAAPGAPLPCEVRRLAVSPNEGCDVGDVDRDGVLDIVAGPLWFAGPDFVPRPLRDVPEFAGGAYLANNGEHLLDVDGDGWLDVVSGGFVDPPLRWFRNPGAVGLTRGLRWTPNDLVAVGVTNEATLAHDVDGDGRPEFVIDSWNDHGALIGCVLALPQPGTPVSARPWTIGARGNGHGLGFGDVDGDGDVDIVCKVGWYERPTGDPFATPWRLHRDFDLGRASCPVLVVDVDRDGRNDLVVGCGHGYGLAWLRQLDATADARRFELRWIDRSISQLHTLAWVTLVAGEAPGVLTGKRVRAHEAGDPGNDDPPGLWFFQQGEDATFVRRELGGTAGHVGTGLQLRTADLDGDGNLDVVASGKTGTFVVFQRPVSGAGGDRPAPSRPVGERAGRVR